MSETAPISFDALATLFDEQRALPPEALSALYHVFLEHASNGPLHIIEPGAGTGRIAIPALAAGHHVTAVDISGPMLDVFASRIASLGDLASRCTLQTGDATDLPFDDDHFDCGLLAQVLYLIPDWELALDELFRVVRQGGEVMLVQERSSMSVALLERDAAWRSAVELEGYRHMPQQPDDAGAVAALRQRAARVTEREVASWQYGQTVANADAGLARLRPLYDALDDDGWNRAVERFRQWRQAQSLPPDTWLGGTVDLVLVRGVVPDSRH